MRPGAKARPVRGIVGVHAMSSRKTAAPRKKRIPPGSAGPRSAGRLQRAIDATVRREIAAALAENDGNVTHAAKALGISRISLHARMNALGVEAQAPSVEPPKTRR